MLTLYYAPGACSMAPHIVLEETGASYATELVSLAKGEQQGDAYLRVNPRGKVPALRTEAGVLTENVAILTLSCALVSRRKIAAGRAFRHGTLPVAHGLSVEHRASGLHAHRPVQAVSRPTKSRMRMSEPPGAKTPGRFCKSLTPCSPASHGFWAISTRLPTLIRS